jgi:hypothetical protein
MRITESQLRSIILQEIQGLFEAEESAALSGEGASKLTDQQKKQLNDLAKSAPSSLSGFSKSLKALATIVDDIDPKAANINASQLAQYWPQIMAIVSSMMSEEKTSSTETSKVAKALG